MLMYNKANQLVSPSVASIQSAMDSFVQLSQGNYSIDIVDGNGTNAWPLSYLVFLSLNHSVTIYDCTIIEELMNFIAWTDINSKYVLTLQSCLSRPYLTRLFDLGHGTELAQTLRAFTRHQQT